MAAVVVRCRAFRAAFAAVSLRLNHEPFQPIHCNPFRRVPRHKFLADCDDLVFDLKGGSFRVLARLL